MNTTYLDYLITCDDQKEVYSFSSQNEATNFGEKLRDILQEELGCGYYEIDEYVSVKISHLTVRIKANANIPELVSK